MPRQWQRQRRHRRCHKHHHATDGTTNTGIDNNTGAANRGGNTTGGATNNDGYSNTDNDHTINRDNNRTAADNDNDGVGGVGAELAAVLLLGQRVGGGLAVERVLEQLHGLVRAVLAVIGHAQPHELLLVEAVEVFLAPLGNKLGGQEIIHLLPPPAVTLDVYEADLDDERLNFGNFWRAVLTLYVVCTGENTFEVAWATIRATGSSWAAAYMVRP